MGSAAFATGSVRIADGGFNAALLAMTRVERLDAVGEALVAVGAAVVLVLVVTRLVRGHAVVWVLQPLRTAEVHIEAIVLPVLVFALASTLINPLLHRLIAPGTVEAATQPADAAIRLIGIAANNLAMVVSAIACYMIGRRYIAQPGRGFVVGQGRVGRQVLEAVLGVMAATALCHGVLRLTQWAIQGVQPTYVFRDHDVFIALRAPDCPLWLPAVLWIGAVVATPIAEEIFFRGIVQTKLTTHLHSRFMAVVVASVIFGLAHLSQPHVVPAITVFGIILGLLYERTGGLVAPIIAHALFNGKSMLWEWLAAG